MDIAALKQRIKDNRETWISVAGFEFKVRRPSKLDIAKLSSSLKNEDSVSIAIVMQSVIDWKNVKASDVMEGEPAVSLEFDAELLDVLVSERFDVLSGLGSAIGDMISGHKQHAEDVVKN